METIRYSINRAKVNNDELARVQCISILELEGINELSLEATEYLCDYTDSEVQNIFKEFLIKNECDDDEYGKIKSVISDYFKRIG